MKSAGQGPASRGPEARPSRAEALSSARAELLRLALYLGLSFAALGLGGALTAYGMRDGWLETLPRPPFQPPDRAFGPVWFVIMTLTAVATARVAAAPPSPARSRALALYAAQLVLNVCWSAAFFALRRPVWGLVDIVLLDLVLIGMVATYARTSRIGAWLLAPYVTWLAVATALNVWIVVHSGG